VQLVNDIVAVGNPACLASFDFNAWLAQPIRNTGQNALQIADAGDKAWRDLLEGLQTTLAVLKDEIEAKAEDFSLPVGAALRAMLATHEGRTAQRKLDAEEMDRQESEARVHALIREAEQKLDDESKAWLDEPSPRLGGMSPRQAAAASAEKLQTAKQALDQAVTARAIKAKWVSELEREATNLLRRVETHPDRLRQQVVLYMANGDPGLPNRVSPKAHTKNEVTMQQCLALLRQRIGKRS
jgi:hypothetical protein